MHPMTAFYQALPDIFEGYSLEITGKDGDALTTAAGHITPGTAFGVAFLPGEGMEARIAAAILVRSLGFQPIPHFSARRLISHDELETYVGRLAREAQVRRCVVIGGDLQEADGPFHDSMALITTGAFERNGIEAIGVAGHPEGHPNMTEEQCWDVLKAKCDEIERRGMAASIATQFGFAAEPFLKWLEELRRRGINAPVRIGIPGPAGIKTLLRFAARCGVGASAAVLAKYGISLTKLVGTSGPDKLVERFVRELGPQHGTVRLHFYPFGGLERTVDWVNNFRSRLGQASSIGEHKFD